MNGHQQPVQNNADKATTDLTTANEILRIAASPRQVKTQTAKIFYPKTLKVSNKQRAKKEFSQILEIENSTENELGTTHITERNRNGLSKTKEELKQELNDLKLNLNEIANKSRDQREERDTAKDATVLINNDQGRHEKDTNETEPIIRRCKTEIIENAHRSQSERRVKSRIGAKARSKSSQPSETKSHELLATALDSMKRKSYNVEEARKFLAEQKRRRWSQQAASNNFHDKTDFEKEQIKKRLEELRKNSRAIITKNVNRKKIVPCSRNTLKTSRITNMGTKANEKKIDSNFIKSHDKIENSEVEVVEDACYCDNNSKTVSLESHLPKPKEKELKHLTPEDEPKGKNIDVVRDAIKNGEIKANSLQSTFSEKKRVGLLRKQEIKDHSFSAIREFNFDKENIALGMMTPNLHQSVPLERKPVSHDKEFVANFKNVQEQPVEITYRKPKTSLEFLESVEHKNVEMSQAKAPVTIQKGNDPTKSEFDVKIESLPNSDLPYWLKPSAVQIYPYNFIMAVRRKLEAIADVKKHSDNEITSTNNFAMPNPKTNATFVSKSKNQSIQKSVKPYGFESKSMAMEKSLLEPAIECGKIVYQNIINPKIHTIPSQSELNSNLSPISIQLMPSSNTVSETTSKKSKNIPLTYVQTKASVQQSEDDTTISSSIFNSPEKNSRHLNSTIEGNKLIENEDAKRTISPLSLERVENLMITSNKKLKRAIAARHVNTNRGGDIRQSNTLDENQTYNHNVGKEIDYNKLLDDFNRSLSQVIEVNDRLKLTINKSYEICSSQPTTIERPEYNNTKESDEYSEDFEKNSSQRSQEVNSELQNIKQTNNIVETEVITSDTDGLKHGEKYFTKRSNAISQSYINSSLSSLNSNVSNEVSQKCVLSKSDEFSHQELYERLDRIEKLKEKFKQRILDSQKKRSHGNCVLEIESNTENEKDDKSEREDQLSSLNLPTNPAKSTDQKEQQRCLNSDSITEHIHIEVKSEIEKNRKKCTKSLKNETDTRDYILSSKYTTASHKILEMFDHSSMEISLGSSNNDSLSDSTCSYSNVGLYEKLIRNETTKSEHLTALLKMREKALFDRTKGQIAWLEVQKERCKSKGLLMQISAIKKKQRGILLKMEKEREEIKRLLQSTSTEPSANRAGKELLYSPKKSDKSIISQKSSSNISHTITRLNRNEKKHTPLVSFPRSASVNILSKYAPGISQPKINLETNRSIPVLRANYSLESSRPLEELLKKRESDLRRRREQVERLLQWHRRLDQEEAEVLQIENALFTYNHEKNQQHIVTDELKKEKQSHAGVVPNRKVHRRLKEIEIGLRELNNIESTNSTTESNTGSAEVYISNTIDYVRTTGIKLNKLWRRLTSQHIQKYEPSKCYQLSKPDLEKLYEEAKVAVLQNFEQNECRLAADLEKSIPILSENISQTSFQQLSDSILVPSLNLCTSSEPSDKEEDTSPNSLLLGNYSPITAAQNFQDFAPGLGTATLRSTTQSSSEANILLIKTQSALNLHPNMRHFSPRTNHDDGLMRSLSDTVIYNKYRSSKDSKKTIPYAYKDNSATNPTPSKSNIEDLPTLNVEAKVKLLLQHADKNLPSVTKHITIAPSSLQIARPPILITSNSSPGTDFSSGTIRKESSRIKEISVFEDNGSKESSEQSSFAESLLHITDEDIKSASCQQDIESSSHHISSNNFDVKNIGSPQQSLSFIISATSSREKIQNDSNNINNIVNELNKCPPIGEQELLNTKKFENESKRIQSEKTSIENETLNIYEDDFETTSELTQIDDLSLPHFESIVDLSLSHSNDNEGNCKNNIQHGKGNVYKEMSVIPVVPETSRKPSQLLPNPESVPGQLLPPSSAENVRLQSASQTINNDNISIVVNSAQLMPDIINELEIRRCQQNEQMKQFDHSSTVMPYMYVREIPNKPPPPYVPPAHGSPMTTIFPSEERIKEISYRRTHELYCKLLKTDYINETGEKLPSVMDEKITNIYERIILDICREYLDDHSDILKQGDPINFYTQLAFFNPPNRLRCMQESVYKKVRRCLAMDKTSKRRTPIYSVYGQRAMRDHIGKIITQETYDEDDKWCNFRREENEVVELIIYDMIGNLLTDLAKEVILEEGGAIEFSNCDVEDECVEGINSSSLTPELKQPINSE